MLADMVVEMLYGAWHDQDVAWGTALSIGDVGEFSQQH